MLATSSATKFLSQFVLEILEVWRLFARNTANGKKTLKNISQQIQAEVIAYSYLATMIKQLLTDATVRSKTTLWTFFTGFFGIAVDEMIHQSQCSTCEAWNLESWDKGSAGWMLLLKPVMPTFGCNKTRDYSIVVVCIPKKTPKQKQLIVMTSSNYASAIKMIYMLFVVYIFPPWSSMGPFLEFTNLFGWSLIRGFKT